MRICGTFAAIAAATLLPTAILLPTAPAAAQTGKWQMAKPLPQMDIRVLVPLGTLLGLTGEPGYLPGFGHIPAELTRQLAAQAAFWKGVVYDPQDGQLLTIGKRDASFDEGLPMPQLIRRSSGEIEPLIGCQVSKLSDQHAFLTTPEGEHWTCTAVTCTGRAARRAIPPAVTGWPWWAPTGSSCPTCPCSCARTTTR